MFLVNGLVHRQQLPSKIVLIVMLEDGVHKLVRCHSNHATHATKANLVQPLEHPPKAPATIVRLDATVPPKVPTMHLLVLLAMPAGTAVKKEHLKNQHVLGVAQQHNHYSTEIGASSITRFAKNVNLAKSMPNILTNARTNGSNIVIILVAGFGAIVLIGGFYFCLQGSRFRCRTGGTRYSPGYSWQTYSPLSLLPTVWPSTLIANCPTSHRP
jgi:hypothetical protein